MVEQLICNHQVVGSTPTAGSTLKQRLSTRKAFIYAGLRRIHLYTFVNIDIFVYFYLQILTILQILQPATIKTLRAFCFRKKLTRLTQGALKSVNLVLKITHHLPTLPIVNIIS